MTRVTNNNKKIYKYKKILKIIFFFKKKLEDGTEGWLNDSYGLGDVVQPLLQPYLRVAKPPSRHLGHTKWQK
jgi:hypothetical protein